MTLRFGRYETLQPIASGGMATVYLGRSVGAAGFERRVAIKVMHPHVAEDPEFIAMFLDEANLAARIHHPNVVSTIDFQRSDEATFLVMEFIDGASLRDILQSLRRSKRRMPIGNAMRILVDTLSGLHAAHELREDDGTSLELVHRDVSPHNILVGADGVTRITDFGVARATARLTSTRGAKLKGKLPYMAPEQGIGRHVDRRADVYAAGVVLWESLTGRRLFKAEHEGELIAKILQGADRRPRELVPVIPGAIDEACMRALALDPDARYESAAAFADALETAAQQSDVRVPTTRQLAAFVHEFKLKIQTRPAGDIEEERSETGAPLSEPSVGSTSGSALSGIGAVRSQRAPAPRRSPRSRLRLLGTVAFALVLVAVGGLAALVSAGRWPMPFGDASPASETTAMAPPAAPPSEPATAEPQPEERVEAVAAPASASEGGGAPSASASVSLPSAGPLPARPPFRPTPAPTPASKPPPGKSSPLGFEPDDL
jgi:serine/threonine-protein kinase